MDFRLAFYLMDQWLLTLVMCGVLLGASEVGYRAGVRRRGIPESDRSLMSGMGGAMFGLLGLLLGFTLSMAIGRWDVRRDVIVSESNAIGTLSLRAGLLDEPLRGDLRDALGEYTQARIVLGSSYDDLDAWRAARTTSEGLHERIWTVIEAASELELSPAVLSSLITSANEVIDLHELRLASIENYLPASLLFVLIGVASMAVGFLAWSFGAGDRSGRKAVLLLSLLITVVLLLIMDLNRPQRGMIEVGVDALERVGESVGLKKSP